MKRFYYRLRIFLVTLAIGLLVVNIWTKLADYYSEVRVDLPQVESESPIAVLLREWKDMPHGGGSTGSAPDGSYAGDGGGSGSDGETCEDFIKSLGKLTKQSRRILAHTPCYRDIPKE